MEDFVRLVFDRVESRMCLASSFTEDEFLSAVATFTAVVESRRAAAIEAEITSILTEIYDSDIDTRVLLPLLFLFSSDASFEKIPESQR